MLVLNPAILKKKPAPQGFDWDTDLFDYWNNFTAPTTNGIVNNVPINVSGTDVYYGYLSEPIPNNFSISMCIEINGDFYICFFNYGLGNPILKKSSSNILDYDDNIIATDIWVENTKNFVVITYNNTSPNTCTVYINNNKITNVYCPNNEKYFEGFFENRQPGIDYMAAWERLLTDEEVTQLYNNGTGLFYPN